MSAAVWQASKDVVEEARSVELQISRCGSPRPVGRQLAHTGTGEVHGNISLQLVESISCCSCRIGPVPASFADALGHGIGQPEGLDPITVLAQLIHTTRKLKCPVRSAKEGNQIGS